MRPRIKSKKANTAFLGSVFIFTIALSLGLATASRLKYFLESMQVESSHVSLFDLIGAFLAAAVFLVFIVYFMKFNRARSFFLKAVFSLIVFWGSLIFFGVWVYGWFPFYLSLALVVLWIKYPLVAVQDAAVLFAVIGAALVLGLSFEPVVVAVLLVIFSLYDIIAVYLTKHMVAMAKTMVESGAATAFFVPFDFKNFGQTLQEAQKKKNCIVLGGGDIIFPLLFCISLMSKGDFAAWLTGLFSLIGFCASLHFFLFVKKGRAIPALPLIAVFSLVGYFVSSFF